MMKLFYPMPSKGHKDHYCTFLDMCTKKPEELPNADAHLSSYDKNLGSFFLSKTAKKWRVPPQEKECGQESPLSQLKRG